MSLTQTYLTIADGIDRWGDTSAFESESDAAEYKDAMIAALRKIAGEFGLTEETAGTGFADCEGGAFALHTPDIQVSYSAFGGVDTYGIDDFEPVDATEVDWFEKIYCAGIEPGDLAAIRAVFAAA